MRNPASLFSAALLSLAGVAAAQPKPDLEKDPTLYVVGYAHLDTQWRWTYPTVIRDYLRHTLEDNFKLFETYPHYVFNFTGSNRYRMMKEYYPEDYAKLKQYIAAGRWFPGGSSVEEGDVNSPSLESLVRQVMYGNRYFRHEFGKESSEYMLPDCFGFPAALPSILAHCGLKGFSTQKLTWGSAVGIPFKVGVWVGPDGKGIVAALNPGSYGSTIREDLSHSAAWMAQVQDEGRDSGVYVDYAYYGTGDIGGGPDADSVAWLERSLAGTGPLKIVGGTSQQMFEDLTPDEIAKLPHYQGDLELTGHSAGSITSEAMMKRWNHQNEKLAHAAEESAVAASLLGAETYPAGKLRDAWNGVLTGQFHDSLAGTALPEAYDYEWNDEILSMNRFASVLEAGIGGVVRGMDTRAVGVPLAVYNPLSLDREDPVEATVTFPNKAPNSALVYGPDGTPLPTQVLKTDGDRATILFQPSMKGTGIAVYDVRPASASGYIGSDLKASGNTLENARFRVTVDADGNVSSIFDKTANRETLSAPIRMAFMHENPVQWPAWNMDWADQQKPPYGYLGGPATVKVVENGPVRVALQIDREAYGSRFSQIVRLAANSDRIEFLDHIDWKTAETALKAVFPLDASNEKATYNWQIGTVERGNDDSKKFEVASQRWFDLTDATGKYGAAVLTGAKFGSDKPSDDTLRLTLLYTPGTRGGYQDQGSQDWGHHDILYGLAPHDGDWRTGHAPQQAMRLDEPLEAFQVTPHGGRLGKSYQLLKLNTDQVNVVAVKRAEDSDEIIVRVQELTGKPATGVELQWANSQPVGATEVDGQERQIGPATLTDGKLTFDLTPYTVRAFAFKFPATERAAIPTSQTVALPYDTDVISSRANRADGDFDGHGRTLAGDQLPDEINAEGVEFRLGPKGDGQKNAVSAMGQTIALPAGGQRVYLLAASADGDRDANFKVGDQVKSLRIADWGGFIGRWDYRVWKGQVPEVAYDWSNELDGIEPGYLKNDSVAWACDHQHSPQGDEPYQYSYLFKYGFDLPAGATSITLPNDPSIKVLAITVVGNAIDSLSPAVVLTDTIARGSAIPAFSAPGAPSSDAITVSIKPAFYGLASAIRYTTDPSLPVAQWTPYRGPFYLSHSATVRACIGADGPIVSQAYTVNDTTPPSLVKAIGWKGVAKAHLAFSEPLDVVAAQNRSNYRASGGIMVTGAAVDDDGKGVMLSLSRAPSGDFTLALNGIQDLAPTPNKFAGGPVTVEPAKPVFFLDAYTADGRPLVEKDKGLPVKGSLPWTLNFYVKMDALPPSLTPIAGFGESEDEMDGAARYICQFASGIQFWGRNVDIPANAQFDLGKWQMMTATFDGKEVTVYKNGVKLVSAPASLNDAPDVLKVAPIDGWNHKNRFKGEVKDLTVWDTCLDGDGVKALLSEQPAGHQ